MYVSAFDYIRAPGGMQAASTGGGGSTGLPADLVFASAWTTGTGTGNAAVQDTSRTRDWSVRDIVGGSNDGWEVRVTATDSRDYPTTNYLRMNSPDGQLVLAYQGSDSYYSAPGVGDSVYLRYYYRYLLTGSHSPGDGTEHGNYFDDHWITTPNWGPIAFGISLQNESTSEYSLYVWDSGANPYQIGANLSKNTTYRFEWKFTRTGTSTYQLGFRIYSVGGTLLYDENDFAQRDPPNDAMSDVTVTGAGTSQWNSVTGFQIGLNSQQGTAGNPFSEYAAFLVRTDDWCGAYSSAEDSWTP